MKKMILGLGALTAVIAPVATAAQCGGSSKASTSNNAGNAGKTLTVAEQNQQDVAAVKAGIHIPTVSLLSFTLWSDVVTQTASAALPFKLDEFNSKYDLHITLPKDLKGVQLSYKINHIGGYAQFDFLLYLTKGSASDTIEIEFIAGH